MYRTKGLLVVSDLHLSEGRNPRTGWIDPREDFLFDDDFRDFLACHTRNEEWKGIDWTLVIAGDFVDFLQVTDAPPGPELEQEGDYGLVPGPAESAWKMRRIMRGHKILFRSLAEFSLRHRVVFISGNHDAEFIFPEVRAALVDGLRELAEQMGMPGDPGERISFRPWFWFEEGIFVEHGHQYDPINAFPSASSPAGAAGRIFLPLGSIFVRYLFNRVETSSPDADNIKPETRFIGWFFRNHPLRSLRFLLTDGGKMLAVVRENRKIAAAPPEAPGSCREGPEKDPGPPPGFSRPEKDWEDCLAAMKEIQAAPILSGTGPCHSLLLSPGRILILASLLLLFDLASIAAFLSPFWSLLLPARLAGSIFISGLVAWNREFQVPLAFLLLQLAAGTILYLARPGRGRSCARVLREKAAAIATILRPEYIIMGHCHSIDLRHFPSGTHYVNTGTWTRIFSYESSAIREEREFTYTRLIRAGGEWDMDLMKWEVQGGAGRKANLIDS